MNLNDMTRRFLMGESKSPSMGALIANLKEVLSSIRPTSRKDQRRLETAQDNLQDIRRAVRILEAQIAALEDRYTERISETKKE